jgi:hypothetical protein
VRSSPRPSPAFATRSAGPGGGGDGGERLVHEKLAALSADERRILREALLEPELA